MRLRNESIMPEDLERLFLRETQRRRQQQRHQRLRRVSLVLTLVLFGAGLVYVLREQVLWLVVMGLSSAGLWLVWGRWGRDRWPELPWLRSLAKSRRWRRYSWGYALLFFILLYQFYPRVVTTPFQTLYARLVYQPAPPTDTPWPWSTEQQLHPAIAQLSPDQETGIRAVANYLKAQEPDPEQQVKAVHDYVISRVTYDQAVLETGERPAQDALTVFQTRKAVCEGYARLFAAIAQAMDLDVVYLEGRVRRDLAPIDVIPPEMRLESPLYDWTLHAWNAVKVNGEWQLVDTTWDDSDADLYSTDYLLPPPDVMLVSHWPHVRDWQLRDRRKSKSEFEASPILTPQFFAAQLRLESPQQYKTRTAQRAEIEIATQPDYDGAIAAFFTPTAGFSVWEMPTLTTPTPEQPQYQACETQQMSETRTQIQCEFPEPGDYQVYLASLGAENIVPLGQLKFVAAS